MPSGAYRAAHRPAPPLHRQAPQRVHHHARAGVTPRSKHQSTKRPAKAIPVPGNPFAMPAPAHATPAPAGTMADVRPPGTYTTSPHVAAALGTELSPWAAADPDPAGVEARSAREMELQFKLLRAEAALSRSRVELKRSKADGSAVPSAFKPQMTTASKAGGGGAKAGQGHTGLMEAHEGSGTVTPKDLSLALRWSTTATRIQGITSMARRDGSQVCGAK